MKFCLTFKTPDVLEQLDYETFTLEESYKIQEFAKKFIKYGEYITVEFDTEKQTAKVIER